MQLRKLVVGAAVMGLAMSAGIAYASIPDSGGTIHGCVKTATATNGTHGIKVIDTARRSPARAASPTSRGPPKGSCCIRATLPSSARTRRTRRSPRSLVFPQG